MKKAAEHLHGQLAGHLTQEEQGYTFNFLPAPLQDEFYRLLERQFGQLDLA